ncbi:MAG TPA: adenylate/guanylate cyclase domain-containing protein, partial [Stellaceae bacterium]|nr:adenylate/guanylate cyclase domain-containing protein [Stellaceae bacterium]
MSENVADERLTRALTAFLRQEVQAPAIAVTDFLDMIIEDARTAQPESMLADLNRMRSASVQLNAFVKSLIRDSSADRQTSETPEAFHRRLRHDLRNPLNAIKGYSELLIEDMDADDSQPLRLDLIKLKESADQLLGQIDAMAALAGREEGASQVDGSQTLKLDLVADVLRALEPLPASGASESAQSSRVLVVDDNASNRDVLARRLVREGHQVVTAANGAAALELVGSETFDLILLDLIMPEMSGFEVLRRLKAAQHSGDIPVIVISALDELDSVVRCIEAGAEDYLTKPFNPILLRARIGASLEKKWLRDREKQFVADLQQEKARSETLLLNILPRSIVDRMRNGEMVIADSISEATILFCDLVGFTTLSADLTAGRTIDFLSRIFSEFDRLAADHGVEKIKTIGDAYMAVAGVPAPVPDHADRLVRMGLEMFEAKNQVAARFGLSIRMRIGIASGPVMGGIIGTHKFSYDVWGDAVNLAARLESSGEVERIQVSASARAAMSPELFGFESRGNIEI